MILQEDDLPRLYARDVVERQERQRESLLTSVHEMEIGAAHPHMAFV